MELLNQSNDFLLKEADKLALYLINEPASDKERSLYRKAISSQHDEFDRIEKTLWNLAMRNNAFLSIIDAGMGIVNPNSIIRKNIFMMTAILEASSGHCKNFFAPRMSGTDVCFLFLRCIFAGIKTTIGVLFVISVKVIYKLWK